jgi:hypothetical protein
MLKNKIKNFLLPAGSKLKRNVSLNQRHSKADIFSIIAIHYAKRIQQSLLPTEKYIERKLIERRKPKI